MHQRVPWVAGPNEPAASRTAAGRWLARCSDPSAGARIPVQKRNRQVINARTPAVNTSSQWSTIHPGQLAVIITATDRICTSDVGGLRTCILSPTIGDIFSTGVGTHRRGTRQLDRESKRERGPVGTARIRARRGNCRSSRLQAERAGRQPPPLMPPVNAAWGGNGIRIPSGPLY